MSFDPKCHELAKLFLDDQGTTTEEATNELAQAIQDVIEDFLRGRDELPNCVWKGAATPFAETH